MSDAQSVENVPLANPKRVNWEMVAAYANSSDTSTRKAGEQFIYDNAMEE